MAEKPDNPNAFPFEEWPGMTLRDYFAGQALAGLLSLPENANSAEQDARTAYEWADAMLQARKDT